ncbi:MAG: patatin-like phospholipase family protein [Acidobacteria bacterium]|nr:MAG: patatin-like phospholipase family protein [Acidobacteriota bacterium]
MQRSGGSAAGEPRALSGGRHDHPVEYVSIEDAARAPREGIAVCLSGGGYRAMLFHAGGLLRLAEAGLLARVSRVSSVSAGSITAAVLALAWDRCRLNEPRGAGERFVRHVVAPLLALAARTLDVPAALLGLFGPGPANAWLAGALDRHLFRRRTLSDLPDEPEFVFNATNLCTGDLFLFRKGRTGDYRVGAASGARLPVSGAVAASAAFPPFLSPAVPALGTGGLARRGREPLHREPYVSHPVLTDGGVYDNLGLEAAWKRFRTVIASDGGSRLEPDPSPPRDWPRHMLRVVEVIDHQVRTMRKRLLLAHFERGTRRGAYWSIRGDARDYAPSPHLPCPLPRTIALARLPTRLKRLDPAIRSRLVNWGYAMADAAVRRFVLPDLPAPRRFPCAGGV